VTVAPSPADIFERSVEEGRRRLGMPLLEQLATGFLGGVTIIFGVVAYAVTDAELTPHLGAGVGTVAGSAAFGLGLVFLIVGRSELFSENLLDPVAAAFEERPMSSGIARLARLWSIILVLNLAGGAALGAVMTVPNALPGGSGDALVRVADDIAGKGWAATLARAVLAGALVALLSYLLSAVDTVLARLTVAYLVGFFLALGPFDHVVVSVLHLLFGVWLGDSVGYGDVLTNAALSTAGNLAGGLLFITLTQAARTQQ
jgi:formate/nitrite transporter FocA (FNT family)